MKKIFLAAVIASASVCTAYAQDPKPQEQKTTEQKNEVQKQNDQKAQQARQSQEMETMIKTELKLTDEQSAKFAAIAKEFNEKKDAIVNDASLSADDKKAKKAALKKEKEAKFLEILTTEQQARYKQLMEEIDKKKETQKQKN
jgi:hypothetical protein